MLIGTMKQEMQSMVSRHSVIVVVGPVEAFHRACTGVVAEKWFIPGVYPNQTQPN
jgi:hypothetical protein